MKVTTTTNVSVNGVMQGLGGPDEDRRGGFERGGWQRPPGRFDAELGAFIVEVYQRADAFLFGRWTYELFAASTTLTDPQWANTTVLSGDVAAAVGELKAEPGGELQVHGSGNLVRWLLDNRLVDEITRLTYPVVVGQGTRAVANRRSRAGVSLRGDNCDQREVGDGN